MVSRLLPKGAGLQTRGMIIRTLLLTAIVTGLHAAEFTDKDAQALVEQLGSEDFKVRKAASDQLRALIVENPEAEKLFEAHQNHPDPEVRVRLREGLVRICLEAKWWRPELEGKIQSPEDKLPRRLTFMNDWNEPIVIHWLDTEGKRKPWSVSPVRPGEKQTCQISYVGHAWLFSNKDGKGLGIFTLGTETTEIRFSGPVQQ